MHDTDLKDISVPTVSVVVPVFNAADKVSSCIESILAQDYPRSRLEIIFVDNGSTDATPSVLEVFGNKINVLREPHRGPGAARNAGIRHARHDFIAFTDADCVADRGWLRALVDRAIADPDIHFIGGPVKALEPSSPVEVFSERLFDHREALERSRRPRVITGNVLVRRTFLHELGLFDATCIRGEDSDLSYRAQLSQQVQFGYAADAVIYHRNPSSPWSLFVEGVKHGRGSAFMLARHGPQLGESPFSRAFDRRRYRNILGMTWRGVRLFLAGGSETPQERNECFYDALFNTGKQIGMIVQATRNSLTRKF